MRIIVDIDGTICSQQKSGDYDKAEPFHRVITAINHRFDLGHEIIYWTARGAASGKDFSELTEKQLKTWGCKYTDLWFGKPSYDLWIDDKSVSDI